MAVLSNDDRKNFRRRVAAKLDAESYPGAQDLVMQIVDESKQLRSWRPLRAAAAALEPREDPIWMTADQFSRWHIGEMAIRRKLANEIRPAADLGISATVRAGYLNGSQTIPKIIALACAHISAGHALPVPAEDHELFAHWFHPRFGAVESITDFLDMGKSQIADRLKGYQMVEGVRRVRQPGPALIRALDWVYRVGPFCPYGDGMAAPVFPGQEIGR